VVVGHLVAKPDDGVTLQVLDAFDPAVSGDVGSGSIDAPWRLTDPATDQCVVNQLSTADGDVHLSFPEVEDLVLMTNSTCSKGNRALNLSIRVYRIRR
jgi:hypothetical protein